MSWINATLTKDLLMAIRIHPERGAVRPLHLTAGYAPARKALEANKSLLVTGSWVMG